jgi:hypothetical protein
VYCFVGQVIPCAAKPDSPVISGLTEIVPFDLDARIRYYCAVTKSSVEGESMHVLKLSARNQTYWRFVPAVHRLIHTYDAQCTTACRSKATNSCKP